MRRSGAKCYGELSKPGGPNTDGAAIKMRLERTSAPSPRMRCAHSLYKLMYGGCAASGGRRLEIEPAVLGTNDAKSPTLAVRARIRGAKKVPRLCKRVVDRNPPEAQSPAL